MQQITLVKNAIHRPDEPRHFMQFAYPDTTFTASVGRIELARTTNALVLSEVGYSIYEPVVYFPCTDVHTEQLEKIEKTTFCPLKGDTEYFNLRVGAGNHDKEIAWRYDRPLSFAQTLLNYIGFDKNKVHVENSRS